MKKIMQLKNKLATLKEEAQALLDGGNSKDAQDKIEEIKNVQNAITMQEHLDNIEETVLEDKVKHADVSNKTKENANVIRAMIKKATGKPITEVENALLLPTEANEQGLSYILPTEVSTKIREKIREYRSLRDAIGYMPVGALSGSFPIEDFETVSELVDFTDGENLTEANDIKFKNVAYALKEKGAFVKLSNTLLQMTDNDLINYIVRVFAKKAVITENKMILTALQKGKTPKIINTWNDLRKSINKDLDPSMLYGTILVTNQDGYDFLDSQTDKNGRPLLQEDVTSPTGYRFKGYPIHAYSNMMLASEDNKAPLFYGNLSEAVKFVDNNGLINFATSSEAGFITNTTLARLIEFIDVIQVDSSDKCYMYGQLTLDVEVGAE